MRAVGSPFEIAGLIETMRFPSHASIKYGTKEQLVKKSGQTITCGDFKVLRYAVRRTGILGEWQRVEDGHRQFRAETGAVLNYWKTTGTGTINFQGTERCGG
jgi:hypothetical protein